MSPIRSGWREVSLGDICEFKYGKSLPANVRILGNFSVYGSNGVVGSHFKPLTDGPTIIVGRKGSLGEVAFSPEPCWPIDTTYYVDANSTRVDLRWLSLRLSALGLTELNRAAAVPGLNREDAYREKLLLPPLEEQWRIAEVLDRADELRVKRREALAQLDDLVQSIFLDMFGDPKRNVRGFPSVRLGELLVVPLRNGVSPSSQGKHDAKVLTLSSITGDRFNSSAFKYGKFRAAPSIAQMVNGLDFLICRGNGNLSLVGRGAFPDDSMSEVVFPDTIIAARVDPGRLCRSFLEHLWNSYAVRMQVESAARTTNGTFKVNQEMIENISVLVPEPDLQGEFDRRVQTINRLKVTYRASLVELDELFASLQDRAFRGEL